MNNFHCILIDIPWRFITCDCLSQQSNGSNSAFPQIHWNNAEGELGSKIFVREAVVCICKSFTKQNKSAM